MHNIIECGVKQGPILRTHGQHLVAAQETREKHDRQDEQIQRRDAEGDSSRNRAGALTGLECVAVLNRKECPRRQSYHIQKRSQDQDGILRDEFEKGISNRIHKNRIPHRKVGESQNVRIGGGIYISTFAGLGLCKEVRGCSENCD